MMELPAASRSDGAHCVTSTTFVTADAAAAATAAASSALQPADSAQSLAASSSASTSTSTCTDFGSSEGGFDDSTTSATFGGVADPSGSLLSLALERRAARNSLGGGAIGLRACSALSLAPQQQQHQLQHQHQHQQLVLPQGGRPPQHQHQQQSSRKRSNAISAKSMSSYLEQYKEAKCTYFDGVLAGNLPIRRPSRGPRFN